VFILGIDVGVIEETDDLVVILQAANNLGRTRPAADVEQ
jgi:hypothetical protein